LVLISTILGGCLKSGNNTPPEKLSYIYYLHMAPTAPSIDMYFDNAKASSSSISFNTISGRYAVIRPGTFAVNYKKAGGDSLVATIPVNIYDSLKAYTLLLYSDDQGHGRATRIVDNMSDVSTEKVNYRFWHLGAETGNVDFYIGDQKVQSDRSLGDNDGFNSYNQFDVVNPGTYKLVVKEAGTNNVLAQTEEANLVKGAIYTFFLKGVKNGTGIKALAIGVASPN